MEDILTESVFDSKLESQNDSATDLFDCLVPENITEDNNSNEKISLPIDQPEAEEEKDEIPAVSTSVNEDDDVSEPVDSTGPQRVADTTELHVAESAENVSSSSVVENDTEPSSVEIKNNTSNDFVPTIVDIFGACNEPMEQSSINISCDNTEEEEEEPKTQQLSQISIGDVKGGFDDANTTNQDKEKYEDSVIDNSPVIPIHTIDDDSDDAIVPNETNTSAKSDTIFNPNVVIKQEPRDEEVDNDCMLIDSDDVGTCFTSEIEIKEERPCENEDPEVLCIETTSQIPQPIPIKIEANFETDEQVPTPKPSSESTSKTTDAKKLPSSSDSSSKTVGAKSFSVVGYKCHLCNTSFQEHELLNEHMKLHRNNSLAERYRRTYNKHRKHSKYICRTCGKRLSTGQSLAQHTMIHNNEKPHICPICKKDFRHLSNFKMHVQKHKEEEELRRKVRERQRLHAKIAPSMVAGDRSVARSADFGRLVGPLFVKETLLSKTASPDVTRPLIAPKVERKPFELKFPRARDSAKENIIFYQKLNPNTYDESYTRARKFNDDIGDDVIPLKTFNNVDNIVMNATKFIVKVDNLDANLLKKKIKTPDISIDKSAIENKPPDRKRRVTLSPPDGAKRLKLDQIENIIMDPTDDENSPDVDYTYADYYDDDDKGYVKVPGNRADAPNAGQTKQETLTDNELFELLNDDRENNDDDRTSANNLVPLAGAPSPSKSNVIVLKSSTTKRTFSQLSPQSGGSPEAKKQRLDAANQPSSFSQYMAEKNKEKIDSGKLSELTVGSPEDAADDSEKCDSYDRAFHNVVLRRLTLIRRKAAQNGGKIEDKYLLGPLFWRKALQKAQNNQLSKEPQMSLNEAKLAYKRLNAFKYGKMDTRRSNDAVKLQQRAELKLQFVLDRVRSLSDLSHVNLAGPLYWKRTLKLAGIHCPRDLKRLVAADQHPAINDVEFVKSEELPKEKTVERSEVNGGDTVIVDEDDNNTGHVAPVIPDEPEPKTHQQNTTVQACDFLENVVENRLVTSATASSNRTNMVDSMLNDELLKPPKTTESNAIRGVVKPANVSQVLRTTADSTKESEKTKATSKAESILYDSLTKPKTPPKIETTVDETPRPKSHVSVSAIPKSSINVPVKPAPTSSLLKNRTAYSSTSSSTTYQINATTSTVRHPATKNVLEITKQPEIKASPSLIERYKVDVGKTIPVTASNLDMGTEIPDSTTLESGNIILNVDSADFQLIADSKAENGEDTNYVLVSDGNGGVQLIKENDLHLVEDEATNTQYVVNMQGENFSNFNLMGNANGDQLTYAIQLDGDNYPTLQFVQDGVPLEAGKDRIIGGEKTVTIDGTNYVIADSAADLNHIGKELSDFLHIDYGALLKNENEDQHG